MQKTDIIDMIDILNVSKAYGLSMIDKTEMAVALTYDDHVDHVDLLQLYSYRSCACDMPVVGRRWSNDAHRLGGA